MKSTVYLSITQVAESDRREMRSQVTHTLLATAGKNGLYLWDRRSNSQHLLSWGDIRELYQQATGYELAEATY